MNNKRLFKRLLVSGLLASTTVLSPGIVLADRGERDHGRESYSHDEHRSHSNRDNYRSYGKHHQAYEHHGAMYNQRRNYGHHKYYAHNKHRYDRRRHNDHTTYIVNDPYYASDFYIGNPLRFIIGLHTNNIDIILRD